MKLLKPRDVNNHLIQQLRRSNAAGAHKKSKKAQRTKDKVALKKGNY